MFNDTIVEHFSNPQHAGALDAPDLLLELGNPVCGDRIRIGCRVADGRIEAAGFEAWGCATSLATADVFCTHASGRPLAELATLDDESIAGLLGELEPSQHHCLEMLRALFAQLRERSAEGQP